MRPKEACQAEPLLGVPEGTKWHSSVLKRHCVSNITVVRLLFVRHQLDIKTEHQESSKYDLLLSTFRYLFF